jgi:thymidine phosphorylase
VKVRSAAAASALAQHLISVADSFGLHAKAVVTDGLQPVGRGIGPALEARDVLSVLRSEPGAPTDLQQRSLALAGALLELCGAAPPDGGEKVATGVLAGGKAWEKFQRICEAQGGMREPPTAQYRTPVAAERAGRLTKIDNRRLARVAKLAGAPDAKAAGVELHKQLGATVAGGEPIYTVHAEAPGELSYALEFVAANEGIFELTDE